MTNTGTRKRRGGRAKGTPNRPKVHIQTMPPNCPKCHCTEMEGLGQTRQPLEYAGKIQGRPYNLVRKLRRKCKGCGQILVQTQYEMHPEGSE